MAGIRLHLVGRIQEQIRRRLRRSDHLRRIEPVVESVARARSGKATSDTRSTSLDEATQCGIRKPLEHRLHAFDRIKPRSKGGADGVPSIQPKTAPGSGVPAPRNRRARRSCCVRGTGRVPLRRQARCRIPPAPRDRQRQLSTSLSTRTPSQSKMMRPGSGHLGFPGQSIRAYAHNPGNNPQSQCPARPDPPIRKMGKPSRLAASSGISANPPEPRASRRSRGGPAGAFCDRPLVVQN